MKVDTRQQILNLAEDYIHEKGYNSFSYADIAKALNIKNAAVHYHFPTKEELGIAIIKDVRQRFIHWNKYLEERNASYLERIEGFFKIYDRNCYTNNRMCLVSALLSDYELLSENLRIEVDILMKEITLWFGFTLEDGREKKQLQFSGNPKHRAAIIQTSLMGALLVSRVMGQDYYENVKQQLINDIKP